MPHKIELYRTPLPIYRELDAIYASDITDTPTVAVAGTVTFTLDNPGEYELRYLKNGGYNDKVRSNTITVH